LTTFNIVYFRLEENVVLVETEEQADAALAPLVPTEETRSKDSRSSRGTSFSAMLRKMTSSGGSSSAPATEGEWTVVALREELTEAFTTFETPTGWVRVTDCFDYHKIFLLSILHIYYYFMGPYSLFYEGATSPAGVGA
jgi:hypothetical protein